MDWLCPHPEGPCDHPEICAMKLSAEVGRLTKELASAVVGLGRSRITRIEELESLQVTYVERIKELKDERALLIGAQKAYNETDRRSREEAVNLRRKIMGLEAEVARQSDRAEYWHRQYKHGGKKI